MEEQQITSDLEDPTEDELREMQLEYEKMKKQQQEIESLQKFQFFKKTSLSDLVTLNTAQVITGIKSFTQPITANRIIKLGGTSNQILLANGDTIDKDKLDYEPIENARYSAIAYGMYETRLWGTLTTQNSRVYLSMLMKHSDPNTVWQSGYTLFSIVDNAIKPKFTGTPSNIQLNAVMFAQRVIGYPIDWTVGAVGSGKTTLLSKLIVIYKQKINPFILYFSNFGADETMALNLNSKNIVLTNITYDEAMYFLPQFDEIKYQVKEIYTYWKLREVNVPYKSDFIQRMKERILITNPIKEKLKESQKDYVKRIADLFQKECIDIIIKYSVPTKIMRFTIPAMIHNVQFEKKLKIVPQDTSADAELKVIKIPILFHSLLLNSLLIFDDIGSNADIQRFSSGLAKTITHLVSDSRHSKNTVFFVAQRPSYLFKTARILSHVMCLGVNLSESDLKQAYEENSIQNLDFDEFMLLYGTLNKQEFIILNKWESRYEILKNQ
ncbi:MAG: hypothetical protein EZS28_002096 [Streblomastix strix]|uniref:Uncharacterized protein n=1 Tax=Streblomastix strix TaxID=222440 RepID=A0A5J4X564_9EUKA|nr:MAG: hypothetical protein EZS28_002096 [Streblomastix strix]